MKNESAAEILLEVELPHAPDKVWRAITEADLAARWLNATDLRAQVGSRFHIQALDGDPQAPPVVCEVIEAVPNRKLQWRQIERESDDARAVESVVTLQLIAAPVGTRLRIVHDQFKEVRASLYDNVVSLADRRQMRSLRTPEITCASPTLRRAA